MKKVFAVSVVGAACVFAVNAGAEEGKSGFYLTGKSRCLCGVTFTPAFPVRK